MRVAETSAPTGSISPLAGERRGWGKRGEPGWFRSAHPYFDIRRSVDAKDSGLRLPSPHPSSGCAAGAFPARVGERGGRYTEQDTAWRFHTSTQTKPWMSDPAPRVAGAIRW